MGDSRCVLCRNGIALEMSMDHKPEDEHELNRIHKAGGKVTCEGRVNGGLNLSRALGRMFVLYLIIDYEKTLKFYGRHQVTAH